MTLIVTSATFHLCLANQIPFGPRESIIFATLNQIQEREQAIDDCFKTAQGKLMESTVVRERQFVRFLEEIGENAHPYVDVSYQFDDNIDSTQEEGKGALARTVTPGVKMNFVGRGRSLNIDANVMTQTYAHRRRDNESAATIDLVSNFGLDRYTLGLSEEMYTNRISNRAFSIETESLAYYWRHTFNAFLGRNFNRTGFDIGYNRATYRYDHSPSHSENRAEEIYSFNQYLRIATKSRLLFSYAHGRAQYQHDLVPANDYNYDEYGLYLTSAFSYKLTGLLNVGYKAMDYKTTGNDYRTLSMGSSVGYRLSDRSNLSFSYAHAHEEVAMLNFNSSISDTLSLSGSHRLAFNPKLTLNFDFNAEFLKYPKANLYTYRSEVYSWGWGINYAFRKWLDFSFDYLRSQTHSNYSTKFDNNTYTFMTSAKF